MRAQLLLLSYPRISSLFFSREKKRKKRITVITEQAPAQASDLVRYCRRPGCGAPVPQAGHGRPRQYCSDTCTSLYHNQSRASRARSADAEADPLVTGPDGDTLAGLEAVLRQGAALARHARAEAARLDPAQVRAQLADADAGRRRAEAAAVVAHAQAAEADQELQAALEALEAARRLQQAAETRAGCAQAEAAAARAGADAAITAARAETGTCQQQARQAADDAAAARIRAETEVTRARQAETDARAETERARADAARERDALHAAHDAQLHACRQLADLHRDRADRAEAALDAARAQPDRPAAQDTHPGRQPDPRRGRTRPSPPDGT